MNLRDILKRMGYTTVDPAYYAHIREWRAWYQGKVAAFHNYIIYNSGERIRRTRAGLNMAKQGCETWANLLWNYECTVSVDDDAAADAILDQALRDNDFWDQTNRLTERAFALGTGAYIVYPDADGARIDYVVADYIFPLTWKRGRIESCAFAGDFTEGGRQLTYLMIHERQTDGTYAIQNRYFERTNGSSHLTPIATPPGIRDRDQSRVKRFGVITPNIANNIAEGVPLGLSVYGNYIDTLKNIDLAYDGIKVSMEIGRPRMGVTNNMLDVDTTSGEFREQFDPNDIAVYDMGGSAQDQPVDVKDLTVPYRAKNFEDSLQTQLNIYSQNLGLGDKAFKWERGSVTTAKQVISDESAMLRTMEKHQEGLRPAIIDVARAVLDIAGKNPDVEISVGFDDSVTRDKDSERQRAWQWVALGRFPFWKYLVDFEGYEEAEAKILEQEAVDSVSLPPGAGSEE